MDVFVAANRKIAPPTHVRSRASEHRLVHVPDLAERAQKSEGLKGRAKPNTLRNTKRAKNKTGISMRLNPCKNTTASPFLPGRQADSPKAMSSVDPVS